MLPSQVTKKRPTFCSCASTRSLTPLRARGSIGAIRYVGFAVVSGVNMYMYIYA